jgi:hypothetical protein
MIEFFFGVAMGVFVAMAWCEYVLQRMVDSETTKEDFIGENFSLLKIAVLKHAIRRLWGGDK